jgi:Na+/H+-translocating membrane pyrophosphatase
MGTLIAIVLGISVFGLLFAAYLARWVMNKKTGSEQMLAISNAIKEGAEAFLRRQNRTILMLAFLFAVVLFVGYGVIRSHQDFDPVGSSLQLATWITLSFVLGALCSVFAGYVRMLDRMETHIPTYPANTEQRAPRTKERVIHVAS